MNLDYLIYNFLSDLSNDYVMAKIYRKEVKPEEKNSEIIIWDLSCLDFLKYAKVYLVIPK